MKMEAHTPSHEDLEAGDHILERVVDEGHGKHHGGNVENGPLHEGLFVAAYNGFHDVTAIGAGPQVEIAAGSEQDGDSAEGGKLGGGRGREADADEAEEVAGEAEVDLGADGGGVVGALDGGVAMAVVARRAQNALLEALVGDCGVPLVGEQPARGGGGGRGGQGGARRAQDGERVRHGAGGAARQGGAPGRG